MCIAIYSPEGKTVNKENLEQCYKNNKDGAGFMYVKNNELITEKGFFDFDEFYQAYRPHEKKKIVIHFRIKTHGKINEENCHPYNVSSNLAFVHNGMINNVKGDEDYSDTWHFNEQIVKPLYHDNQGFLKKPYIRTLLSQFIGYSKLIFMDSKERISIINEDKGQWDNGVWYSNSSYEIPKVIQLPIRQNNWHNVIMEGEYVTFRYNYGGFKKGNMVYVEDVLPNGHLRIVHHDIQGTDVKEITRVVPSYVVESLDYDMEYAL